MASNIYRNLKCISKLGSLKDNFIRLVDDYAQDLTGKIEMEGSVYTEHDFDSHCTNIYRIISDVLLSEKAYGEGGLSERELYILDLAVLFHDISMSADMTTERNNHSEKSAEYVQGLYNNHESALYKKSGLKSNDVKALKVIIKAHSDVKDGSVPPEEMGLKDPELKEKMPCLGGDARARFLAGILRLADELDITSDRLGNTNIEDNLNKFSGIVTEITARQKAGEGRATDEGDLAKYSGYVESLSHWKKLHLFSEVRRESQDFTIKLVTDDDYITNRIENGETPASIAREVTDVYGKIVSTWNYVQEEVIEKSPTKVDLVAIFPCRDIQLVTEIDQLDVEIRKQLDEDVPRKLTSTMGSEPADSVRTEPKNSMCTGQTSPTIDEPGSLIESGLEAAISVGVDIETSLVENPGIHEVKLLDGTLSEELSAEIERRHLLKIGHFRIDDKYCARDWVDTREIIETGSLSDKIIKCFLDNLKKVYDPEKKYLIIGLDLEGALLASRLAVGMKMAFSYIIPVREQPYASAKETEISVSGYDELIMVTDAIVAFDTIKKAVEEIASGCSLDAAVIQKKISRVYTIFYRKSEIVNLEVMDDLIEKTCCINQKFPVELVKKSECHYAKENRCVGMNVRMG